MCVSHSFTVAPHVFSAHSAPGLYRSVPFRSHPSSNRSPSRSLARTPEPMSFLRNLWRGYLNLLDRRPIFTKCTTSGIIMVAGDTIQQGIEYRTRYQEYQTKHQQQHTLAAESRPIPSLPSFVESYDIPRSIRSGVFGALAVGPVSRRTRRTRTTPDGISNHYHMTSPLYGGSHMILSCSFFCLFLLSPYLHRSFMFGFVPLIVSFPVPLSSLSLVRC